MLFIKKTEKRAKPYFLIQLVVSDALHNIFDNSQQEAVASYGATIYNALANVSHVMRSYGNGPVSR